MAMYHWVPELMCPKELTEGREYTWFCKMWEALWKRGKASYRTNLESAIVKARAVTIHLLLYEFDFKMYGHIGDGHRPLDTDLITVEEAKMLYRHFSSTNELPRFTDKTKLLTPAVENLRKEVVDVFIDEFGLTKWTALTYYLFDLPKDVITSVDELYHVPEGRTPMTIEEFDKQYWDYLKRAWRPKLQQARNRKSLGAKRAIGWIKQGCPCVNPSYAF